VFPSDVHAELSALDTTQAYEPGGICIRLLKEGAAELLAAIFNESLADGVLPVDWVSANITPVSRNVINILSAIINLLV